MLKSMAQYLPLAKKTVSDRATYHMSHTHHLLPMVTVWQYPANITLCLVSSMSVVLLCSNLAMFVCLFVCLFVCFFFLSCVYVCLLFVVCMFACVFVGFNIMFNIWACLLVVRCNLLIVYTCFRRHERHAIRRTLVGTCRILWPSCSHTSERDTATCLLR